MRRRRLAIAIVLCLAAGRALAQPAASPFDALVDEYKPYLDVDAPLGFDLKLRAITRDEYRYWRGTKGQFFAWAREHAGDFRDDPTSRVPAHADLHFGNIGVYAAGPKLGDVAFGVVDFDDAIELPFQIELLQAFVTTRLVARQNGIAIDAADVDRATIDAYRAALTSGRDATTLLAGDKVVAKMLAKAKKAAYASEVETFCKADGGFRASVAKPGKPPTEVLDAIDADPMAAIAAAVARTCASDPALAALLKVANERDARGRVVGIVRRTRLGSSGSQGLEKLLVRFRGPIDGEAGDVLLYLKQEIPTAAERAAYVTRDGASPGERAARLAAALARPAPIVNASVAIGAASYLLTLKEPWSDELDADDVTSAEELLAYARIWGTVAGAAHGADGRGTVLAAKLDGPLVDRLARDADAYLRVQRDAFTALAADPRVIERCRRADAAIAAHAR